NFCLHNMQELFDRLEVLNYKLNFCKKYKFKPIHKFYFIGPASNQNEQFHTYVSLWTWLLNILGVECDYPDQFDDPNETISNLLELTKEFRLDTEIPPLKLRMPFGDTVVNLLNSLAKMKIERDKVLRCPEHTSQLTDHNNEELLIVEEEEHGDFLLEDHDENESDSDESIKSEGNAGNSLSFEIFDINEWKLEIERAIPQLKIQLQNDHKDWRIHLEQMKSLEKVKCIWNYKKGAFTCYSDTVSKFSKLEIEIDKTLEKVSSREKYINQQMESEVILDFIFHSQVDTFKQNNITLSNVKLEFQANREKLSSISTELGQMTEELDMYKAQMDELGSGMTDAKPLVNIKQAISRLKTEIKQLDLKTGVVEQRLWHSRMQEKGVTHRMEEAMIFT
ncbi:hypothetical protein ROZALSC1DRAFT_12333, partial [Rozella allomycis CSF55]